MSSPKQQNALANLLSGLERLPADDFRFTSKDGHAATQIGCPPCVEFVAEVGGFGRVVWLRTETRALIIRPSTGGGF
jgi:hypothetical protein